MDGQHLGQVASPERRTGEARRSTHLVVALLDIADGSLAIDAENLVGILGGSPSRT